MIKLYQKDLEQHKETYLMIFNSLKFSIKPKVKLEKFNKNYQKLMRRHKTSKKKEKFIDLQQQEDQFFTFVQLKWQW